MNMKGLLSFALIIFTASSFLRCSGEQEERNEVVARINNFELTSAEFERQLARELELETDFRLTKEAKKRGLYRKEKFIKSMERYWEATLIRDLMELKGAEIAGRTSISTEEIQGYYRATKASEKTLPPLHMIETELIVDLKEKKKSARMEAWMNDLQAKARIEVHEDVLYRD